MHAVVTAVRGLAVVTVVFFAWAGDARAAHPCGDPHFRMELIGPAYVDEIATFRYFGPVPKRVDWGDGSANGPRRVVRDRLRHRFRRTGRLTVTVVQAGFGCCTSDHASCSEADEVVRTLSVRVRRAR
jgi:hypothetical protein